MIVFHNFIHLTNNIGENELFLVPQRICLLYSSVVSQPSLFLNALFSFFGHYGVQLFVFVSGYGLCKQYMAKGSVSYRHYIIPKIIKLYSLLVFGIIIYLLLFWGSYTFSWAKSFAVSTLLMYNNFSYDRIFLFVGPWWYFSLAIQLYILFPFLYKILNKYSIKGFGVLLVVVYILILGLSGICEHLKIPVYGNFLGHLPEFVLGMGFAMFPKLKISWPVVLIASIVFVAGNFFYLFFSFTFLSVTVILLAVFYRIYQNPISNSISRLFAWLGGISMFVFVINGPLRTFTYRLLDSSTPLQVFGISICHFIIVLAVSLIMSFIYKKLIAPNLQILIKILIK